MSTPLVIAAARADHYTGIARSIAGISSRMAALETQYASVAPRTPADEAWIDMLAASASDMLAASMALKAIVFVPPAPPEPEGGEGDPGDETV